MHIEQPHGIDDDDDWSNYFCFSFFVSSAGTCVCGVHKTSLVEILIASLAANKSNSQCESFLPFCCCCYYYYCVADFISFVRLRSVWVSPSVLAHKQTQSLLLALASKRARLHTDTADTRGRAKLFFNIYSFNVSWMRWSNTHISRLELLYANYLPVFSRWFEKPQTYRVIIPHKSIDFTNNEDTRHTRHWTNILPKRYADTQKQTDQNCRY